MEKISLVSNVSLNDLYRIRQVIPHWIRTFDPKMVDEIIIVVDRIPATGRIAVLHQFSFSDDQINAALKEVAEMDARIKIIDLDRGGIDQIGIRWFGVPGLDRCQGGTPIFPFFFAIEQAKNKIIIKLDSDMIFYSQDLARGIYDAFNDDPSLSLLSLPRYGDAPHAFSTRAYALNMESLDRLLPFKNIRLDYLRCVHRQLTRRASFRAPEDTIELNIRSGRIQHKMLENRFGWGLHVTLGWWPGLAEFPAWLSMVESGEVPVSQRGWDFEVQAWC